MNVDDLKEEYLGVASNALKDVTEEQTKSVQERLNRMIDYAIGRFDWYENERHKFLGIALIALPILAAQARFSLDLPSPHPLSSVFGVLSSLVGFGSALAMMHIYVSASEAPHPYRKLADIRSWYFRYSLRGKLEPRLDDDPDKAKEQVERVLRAYKNFSSRWAELLKKKKGFLEEDLQQVFILQLLQKHRQENLKEMVAILKVGTILYVAFLGLAIITYIFS